MTDPIYVTKPHLPPLSKLLPDFEGIWSSGILTNNGPLHQRLEQELAEHLNVPYISLFTNGTVALLTAIQALNLRGEVITTPFSFAATTNAISWNRLSPIFADTEPGGYNISPKKIKEAITANTSGIIPVNCYGFPCDYDAIAEIAREYGLKVIYDASHSFGTEQGGRSTLLNGDLATLSFHATKVYNTIEGGAVVSHSLEMKKHIDNLKNFGIVNEESIVTQGINGKMNEISAAIGLAQLEDIGALIQKRKALWNEYSHRLRVCDYIVIPDEPVLTQHNYSYYPIIIPGVRGITRDLVYNKLKTSGIYARKYFYPLLSNLPMYDSLPSATCESLPNSNRLAATILCLPIYPDLSIDEQDRIIVSLLSF